MVSRPLSTLFATVALMGAAAPALAQTGPAGVVTASSVRVLGSQTRAFSVTDQTVAATQWRAPAIANTPPPVDRPDPAPVPHRIAAQGDNTLKVDIRAKPEWSDDQGLRFNYTNVSYKQRF